MPRYQQGEYVILYFDRFGAKVGYEYSVTLTQAREMANQYDAESYAILRTLDNSVERGQKWESGDKRMENIARNGNCGEHYGD